MIDTVLIPTQLKCRIPMGFSYPLKAIEVSKLLHGVPDFDRCSLYFNDRPTLRKSKYATILREKGEMCIFDLADRNLWDDSIQIEIIAVPSEYILGIREILLVEHAQTIRDWFDRQPSYQGQMPVGRERLEIHYHLGTKKARIV